MTPELEALADDDILRVLHRTRVVTRKGKFSLQRFPYRPERRDSRQRSAFTVWAGSQPVAHLIVGQSLGGLHRHSQEFHRHNPDLGCQPLFFFRHGGIDFFGQEFLGKHNLEEALSTRQIDVPGWQRAVREVAAALAATTQPSTLGRLTRELAQFEQQVLGLEALTRLDHVFLRDSVFPLVRLGAMKQPPATAWSNGDFIAKNIILDATGRARLIDYEFAHRTHFPAGDWFRLTRFSHLPEGTTLEDLAGLSYLPPWLEIRCWLEHAVKMTQASSLQDVQNDLPKISRNLARLVESATSRQYDSVFFSLAPAQEMPVPVALAVPDDTMSVEWSRHGSMQTHLTTKVDLQPHHWSEVRVDMSARDGRALFTRLRLPANPCIVELRSVEVHGRERSDILWTVPSAQLDSVMSCSGNILETPTDDGLGLVHFGGESVVGFPPIRLAKSENAVGLAFWMRYVPTVADFTHRLRQAFAEGDVPAILSGSQAIARIEGTSHPAREVVAQVFFSEDNHYREEDSIRTPLQEANAWSELSFDLPALPAGAIIRLDPADQPGTIEIARLTLEPAGDPGSGREAGARPASRKLLEGITCENDAILMPDEDTVRILSFGTDPALKLAPLAAELAGRPCRLSLSLRYSPQVPAAIWSQALRDRRAAVIGLNVRLHEESIRSGALARELEDAISEAAIERQRLGAELAQTAGRVEEIQSELRRVQAEVVERERAARVLGEEQTRHRFLAELAAVRDQATATARESAEAAARSAQAIHELEAALAAAVARLETDRQDRAKERQVTEQKHAQLVESLHAQNARLLDVEHQAEMINQELDQAQAENARLHATMARVGQRLLVRLDRQASRLLRAGTRKGLPA